MTNFGRYLEKEQYIVAILRVLRDHGWICPEYEHKREKITRLYNAPEYFGTIAQKGDWSFVLWKHSPYAKEFAVPRGRNWALYFKNRVIDSGRNLKPPESVIKRVIEMAEMPTAKLVAMILASS